MNWIIQVKGEQVTYWRGDGHGRGPERERAEIFQTYDAAWERIDSIFEKYVDALEEAGKEIAEGARLSRIEYLLDGLPRNIAGLAKRKDWRIVPA